MVHTIQVREHFLVPNDGTVALDGHLVLAFIILLSDALFLVKGFATLDDGSESCGEEEYYYHN